MGTGGGEVISIMATLAMSISIPNIQVIRTIVDHTVKVGCGINLIAVSPWVDCTSNTPCHLHNSFIE